jgi:hypothetical protein
MPNNENIKQLMKHYMQPRANFLSIHDAVSIFYSPIRRIDVIPEKDAIFCYGMSKMTNPFETKDIRFHKNIMH